MPEQEMREKIGLEGGTEKIQLHGASAVETQLCVAEGAAEEAAGSSEAEKVLSGPCYCTEEQLEEFLLRNLDQLYKEAVSRLVSFGYDEDLALSAVIRSGSCYGSMDALTNIIENSLARIGPSDFAGSSAAAAFYELRQRVENSFIDLLSFVMGRRPNLTRGDATWCLLMSDLQVGRACSIAVPVDRAIAAAGDDSSEKVNDDIEAECARYFGLSPAMESLLRDHVAAFTKEFGSKPKTTPISAAKFSDFFSLPLNQIPEDDASSETPSKDPINPDPVISAVIYNLSKMRIEGDDSGAGLSEDGKQAMVKNLTNELHKVDQELKDKMERAQRRALEAARKLSRELTELRTLRQEREETVNEKNQRGIMNDTAIQRIEEMEENIKILSVETADLIHTADVMEEKNKELKAEIAAFNLSAAESLTKSAAAVKREKKLMKRLATWEKQREELERSIQEEKSKIDQSQRRLTEIQKEKAEKEEKLRQETKAKEAALEQVKEAREAKESCRKSLRLRRDNLRRKIDDESRRQKENIRQLQDELAILRASRPDPPHTLPRSLVAARSTPSLVDVGPRGLVGNRRECLMCSREVSVVFLPCAHQVLCVGCNESHELKARPCCPSCNCWIEKRIGVFGTCS